MRVSRSSDAGRVGGAAAQPQGRGSGSPGTCHAAGLVSKRPQANVVRRKSRSVYNYLLRTFKLFYLSINRSDL